MYNNHIIKKSLKETNPYLKDPELGKALLYQSVSSSTAVEGVLIKYPKLSKEMKKRVREIAAAQQAKKKSHLNISVPYFDPYSVSYIKLKLRSTMLDVRIGNQNFPHSI